ncbi:MAG TPA: winged helix-turn-helix domain-containing protein [Solirubrobacteraceae bacterium]|jgi:DNA-binding transcriptional ArsR family regulator|nr:winged helix-turn-helix domain-containing protein [Solirubrobacteraceae bacterium]
MARRPTIKPITDIEDPRYVKALAHPLRIRILALLAERDASPVQLAQHLDATLGTVAYHVRTLEKLGLIEMVATHQRRGATEHVYAAREHPRITDRAWSASSPMTKHVMIASILSQIGEYATQSAAAGGFDRADAHFTRTPLRLDEEGWSAMAAATKEWLAQVAQIETETQARLATTVEEPFDAGLVILLFEARRVFDPPPDAPPRAPGGQAPSRTGDRDPLGHLAP